jgi:hypothetical protein
VELEALDYEVFFAPHLPRRTALNRLTRLREAGLVERHGEARSAARPSPTCASGPKIP